MLDAIAAVAVGAATVWNGVTLLGPASTLRAQFGDPVRLIVSQDGTSRIARYWIPGAESTYFLVIETRGYIRSFDVFTEATPQAVLNNVAPDPSGIRLGEPLADVSKAHPDFTTRTDDGTPTLTGHVTPAVAAVYSFAGDRLHSFQWIAPVPESSPALAPITMPSGDSPATAILDMMKNETDGVAWEYRYLAFQPCDKDTRWRLMNQSLIKQGERAYDRLQVVCPSTKAERDFYFDIAAYFGKL